MPKCVQLWYFPQWADTELQVVLLKNLNVEGELVNGSRGRVVDFIEIHDSGIKRMYPIVEFLGEKNKITSVIKPETWTVSVGSKVVASREQLPLNLAWALSIHKVS